MSSPQNLAENLRTLCSRHRSVAEICRQIGINRQQFNKYLGGSSLPSPYTLTRLGRFFGVSETQLLLPPAAFATSLRERTPEAPMQVLFVPSVEQIRERFPDSARKLQRYCGYYHVYYCSPAFPRMIIRSISRLCEKDGLVYDRQIERLGDRRDPNFRFAVSKSTGTVLHTDDRIYSAYFNLGLHQTLAMQALYPSYRSVPRFLSGVFVSVSSGPARQPFASRVVYEYLGDTIILRDGIAACGLYADDSEEIGEEVRSRVRNVLGPGETTLRALEY
jgi:transcriptional regulator with XRE-family HTH domain